MGKGYWIVGLTVTDPERYAEYSGRVRPFLAERGARFLTRGGRYEGVEGDAPSRHVVVEFPTYEQALDAYHSDAYQTLIGLRTAASHGTFVIVEGFEG
ncbi:MAG TPA: DUF1330 domain-containing protein [Devosiaceae bacterium]